MIKFSDYVSLISENTLYTDQATKTAFLADRKRVATAFVFSFLGILGLLNGAKVKATVQHYLKSDKKLRLQSIGDANNDTSISLKALVDSKAFIKSITPENITKFLVILRNGTITDVNSTIVRDWILDIRKDAFLNVLDSRLKGLVTEFISDANPNLHKLAIALKPLASAYPNEAGEFNKVAKAAQLNPLPAGVVAPTSTSAPTMTSQPPTSTLSAIYPPIITPPSHTVAPSVPHTIQHTPHVTPAPHIPQATIAPVTASHPSAIEVPNAHGDFPSYEQFINALSRDQRVLTTTGVTSDKTKWMLYMLAALVGDTRVDRLSDVNMWPGRAGYDTAKDFYQANKVRIYGYLTDYFSRVPNEDNIKLFGAFFRRGKPQYEVVTSAIDFMNGFLKDKSNEKTLRKIIQGVCAEDISNYYLDIAIQGIIETIGKDRYVELYNSFGFGDSKNLDSSDAMTYLRMFSISSDVHGDNYAVNAASARRLFGLLRTKGVEESKDPEAHLKKLADMTAMYSVISRVSDIASITEDDIIESCASIIKTANANPKDKSKILRAALDLYPYHRNDDISAIIANTIYKEFLLSIKSANTLFNTGSLVSYSLAHLLSDESKAEIRKNTIELIKADDTLSLSTKSSLFTNFVVSIPGESGASTIELFKDVFKKEIEECTTVVDVGMIVSDVLDKRHSIENMKKTKSSSFYIDLLLWEADARKKFPSPQNSVRSSFTAKNIIQSGFADVIEPEHATKILEHLADKEDNTIKYMFSKESIKSISEQELKARTTSFFFGLFYDNIEKNPKLCDTAFENLDTYMQNAVRKRLQSSSILMSSITSGPIKPFDKITSTRLKELLSFNDIDTDKLGDDLKVRKIKNEGISSYTKRVRDTIASADTSIVDPKISEVKMSRRELDMKTVEMHKRHNAKRHSVALKINMVFDVHLPEDRYLDFCKRMDAAGFMDVVNPAFHGTGGHSAMMILRYGFRILSERDPSVVGRMLGHGIYFANNIDKAAQYVGNKGFTRTVGTKGYLFDMNARLGERNKNFKDAESIDKKLISPEWCVLDASEQLKIIRAYEVEIVNMSEIDRIASRIIPLGEKHTKKFGEYIGESIVKERQQYESYIFWDGVIPTSDGRYFAYDDPKLKKLLPRGARIEETPHGPAVFFRSNKTVFNDVRWATGLANEHRARYNRLFDGCSG